MKYLLDTNICIYALKANPPEIAIRMKQLNPDDMGIAAITVAELRFGASKSQRAKHNHDILDVFLGQFAILPFDTMAAVAFGNLQARLASKGTPIGAYDALIAAQALALKLTVVTHNLKEFKRVNGLKVESWVTPHLVE